MITSYMITYGAIDNYLNFLDDLNDIKNKIAQEALKHNGNITQHHKELIFKCIDELNERIVTELDDYGNNIKFSFINLYNLGVIQGRFFLYKNGVYTPEPLEFVIDWLGLRFNEGNVT